MKLKNFIVLFVFLGLCLAGLANAAVPSLSISNSGSANSVQINVTGDPSVSVLLFYSNSFAYLGTTNGSGTFSTTVDSSTYNIATNAPVYVKTGGVSGSQSNTVLWPYVQSTSSSALSLSPGALLLNAGQTSTVTANASYLYLLSNSNPTVANINLNANQITVSANTYGTTDAKICVVGNSSNCADLTITVQNSGSQQLTFSQNNFSIYSGQTTTVAISGNAGPFTITNNSNSTSVQASINGSNISLTASSTSGTSSITVCNTAMDACGILNVNATTINSTAVNFSQSNPFVQIGQSATITIYGGTGTNFYVSSNSNPSIVQANITGNTLTLIGNAIGTSSISICAYAGSCASLIANITNGTTGGAINLSQSSVSILAGQSTNITISGGSLPYTITSSNSTNIFNSNINGNILTIYGVNSGSATANVCCSDGCTNLSVVVGNTNSLTNPPSFDQNNILLSPNQQKTVYVSGGGGGYYIANNSSSAVASATISGSSITVSAISAGSSNISVCQSGGQCSVLYVTVSASQVPVVTPVTTPVENYFTLARYLGQGDKGDDVLQLQKMLVKLKLLSAVPNGHYGPSTKAAIKAFQKIHKIKQTGNVGSATKNTLEALKISI